jgi:hypothetical protein
MNKNFDNEYLKSIKYKLFKHMYPAMSLVNVMLLEDVGRHKTDD